MRWLKKRRASMRPQRLSVALVVSLCALASPANGLKVSVSIPELVKLNDAFWLNCSHNQHAPHQPHKLQANALEGDQLEANERIYSIKWYKDEEEFYRYLPSAEPKVSIYETNGISLDRAKSHEGNVYLTKADVNSEGVYRCEVLSEAPLFETVRKSKRVRVYALPVRGPRIEILDSNGRVKNPKAQEISYEVGDRIELRCNSAPSKPAARLRWYLNERELLVPAGPNSSSSARASQQQQAAGGGAHNVRVTPVEYRQHYKNIYSSHSTLSLVLQRDDLINSRISFKCLASMRQEVPIQSKQLIVLTPQPTAPGRSRRQHSHEPDDPQPPAHRSRTRSNARQQQALELPANSLGADYADEQRAQQSLAYIYESSDSTLGPSIIDGPETLARYLAKSLAGADFSQLGDENGSSPAANNLSAALEFSQADNLEHVQQLRERLSRARSFPAGGSQTGPSATSLGSGATNHHKRLYAPSALVRSPLYLDELDPLRPVINWPPLESGKLVLLPSGRSIVAVPTTGASRSARGQQLAELRPKGALEDSPSQQPALILERLVEHMNCTSSEFSIDTKLSWLVNELPLSGRDTRHFPTRISPDHRQTWLTIGLQPTSQPTGHASSGHSSAQTPSSLANILAQYYRQRSAEASSAAATRDGALRMFDSARQAQDEPQVPSASADNQQLRFACQAIHSMLLYSSSEMITFDFNPPAALGDGADKFSSLPSNVIPAATGE